MTSSEHDMTDHVPFDAVFPTFERAQAVPLKPRPLQIPIEACRSGNVEQDEARRVFEPLR
jgi:hypothetical protein